MILQQRSLVPARRGLTLVELIVVLMILVALASVLIPMLPSMLTRAHVAAHTTNVTELSKLVVEYQAVNNGYPDHWDALTDGTALVNYLAGGVLDPQAPPAGGQAGGTITASVPTANELSALNNSGISRVHLMVATAGTAPWDGNPFDPTFDNYSAAPTAPTTITAGTNMAYLDPTANPAALALLQTNYPGWSTTARYVVLGIGPRCTLIGKSAVSAPVHFGDTPSVTPAAGYGRFVAIFKVSDTAPGVVVANAVFMGTAAIHDVGPTGLDAEFQNWYQLNNGGS